VTHNCVVAHDTLCVVIIVVLAAVPEVHIEDEQLDRAEPAGRPPRGLLDELGAHVGDTTVEFLEQLGAALNGGEIRDG